MNLRFEIGTRQLAPDCVFFAAGSRPAGRIGTLPPLLIDEEKNLASAAPHGQIWALGTIKKHSSLILKKRKTLE